MKWYEISNAESIDTPAFLIYPDRIRQNIDLAIQMRGDAALLRPHVKTTKTPEVVQLMMERGIRKYKCATIAEAEMLGRLGAPDVLLAYQPVGPKIKRLNLLMRQYPETSFAALVDNLSTAKALELGLTDDHATLRLYVDINVGQNRTGIRPEDAPDLIRSLKPFKRLLFEGVHVYDGHIRDRDYQTRVKRCDEAFEAVISMLTETGIRNSARVVIGGSPSFSVHCRRADVDCSPGTFVYWDYGYASILPEQGFDWAALVMCRVISRLDSHLVCVDLGHKAIASENPFPRIHFLNLPESRQIGHSEEHLVLDVGDVQVSVGDVLYGVPYHVCPTCNLYERANVVRDHRVKEKWRILARDRSLSI